MKYILRVFNRRLFEEPEEAKRDGLVITCANCDEVLDCIKHIECFSSKSNIKGYTIEKVEEEENDSI